jgi:hypothetical protein
MFIVWFSGTSEGRERAIGTEKHLFGANSAATRKLPTHPKILQQRHRHSLSADLPIVVRGGRPR